MGIYAEKAKENFLKGYNCAQAVVLAFSELMELDGETAVMMASPFGGGMGRMREVCGAVSGMLFVVGKLLGYSSPTDGEAKAEVYTLVQKLADSFRAENGSIICRELLDGEVSHAPIPSERTAEYYKKRPCAELVEAAAEILEDELRARGRIC